MAARRQTDGSSGFAALGLKKVPQDGSLVAVVTMTGSCCPITRAHSLAFESSRDLLLRPRAASERYTEVLGLLSLNGDRHVGEKLRSKGQEPIPLVQRGELVRLAAQDLPWMDLNPGREHSVAEELQTAFPRLRFHRFAMNGADDVYKYQKWRSCGPERRMITMGRPGFTAKVLEHAQREKVLDQGYFLMGPELPDISSTAVRLALKENDGAALETLLHPKVAAWLLRSGIYGSSTASAG
ncbi:unnamed protein product [Effrenium voratum]|nr:unnamed protein product [Effrenium voratum]